MAKRATIAVAAALALLVGSLAAAQQTGEETISLQYKWKAGDRYTWALTSHSKGKVSVLEGVGAGRTVELDTTVSLTIFGDVLEVLDDGSARMKISFGMISSELKGPQGQVIVTHINPATGDIEVELPNGQRQKLERQLPEAVREMLGNGFTATITPAGKISNVEGLEKLQSALQKVAGPQAAGLRISQMLSWLEPPLPEAPVKVGDEWQKDIPWIFGGEASTKKLTMKFRYAGKSTVDGVDCAKVEASMQISGLDMKIEPGTIGPLGQEIKGLSVRMFFTYYLDLNTGHVIEAHGRVSQSGTVRQWGTIEVNDQEQNIDSTVQFDDLTVDVEVKMSRD